MGSSPVTSIAPFIFTLQRKNIEQDCTHHPLTLVELCAQVQGREKADGKGLSLRLGEKNPETGQQFSESQRTKCTEVRVVGQRNWVTCSGSQEAESLGRDPGWSSVLGLLYTV